MTNLPRLGEPILVTAYLKIEYITLTDSSFLWLNSSRDALSTTPNGSIWVSSMM